jgi:hypothetical protein
MAQTAKWWHRRWVRSTESVLWRIAAIIVGFVMMVVGLALGVTMIMLPVGLVVGLIGVTVFLSGLFAHMNPAATCTSSDFATKSGEVNPL